LCAGTACSRDSTAGSPAGTGSAEAVVAVVAVVAVGELGTEERAALADGGCPALAPRAAGATDPSDVEETAVLEVAEAEAGAPGAPAALARSPVAGARTGTTPAGPTARTAEPG